MYNSIQTAQHTHRTRSKPVRDHIIESGLVALLPIKNKSISKNKPGVIEVTDQTENSIFGPKSKVNFANEDPQRFDSLLDIQSRHGTSIDPRVSRPVSTRDINFRKSSRVVNRSIKLKDELALRASQDKSITMNRTLAHFNVGTILNYNRASGINDKSALGSFRKWTGMPQTTRASKVPGVPLIHQAVVDQHRKQQINTIEKQGSIDGSVSSLEPSKRQISQSAWNKIRVVELKKKDRLNFN